MLPTRTYTFTIPAGGMYPLLVVGRYFKVLSATGPFDVSGDTFGTFGPLLAGQGLRETAFNQLQFIDESGAANRLTVLVGDSSLVDDRITGEVSFIDGAKARTMSGVTFMVSTTAVQVAGQYPYTQLFNPAASGRNVVLQTLATSGAGATAGFGNVRRYDVAFGTANVPPVSKGFGFPGAAMAQCRAGNNAALVGGAQMLGLWYPASGQWIYSFKEPLVLAPGTGVLVQGAFGGDITTSFEFFEDPV